MYVTSWELVTPPCSGCGLGATTGGRATRNTVVDAYPKTQQQWEGYVANMYSDPIGLVTTGIGNLIDGNSIANPMASNTAYALALQLPWVHKSDGQPATQAEIIQDWQTVKAARTSSGREDLKNDAKITQLKLSPLAIQDLVASKMLGNEAELLKSFPGFASFPADAQMAIHGMAWAMGSAFVPVRGFTQFAAAANRGDWLGAKASSHFKGEAPQRQAGQDKMFDNAAAVAAGKLDPDRLWYPDSAPTTALGSALAVVRRPVVAAAIVAGLAAVCGGIYLATRPAPRRRLPAAA